MMKSTKAAALLSRKYNCDKSYIMELLSDFGYNANSALYNSDLRQIENIIKNECGVVV